MMSGESTRTATLAPFGTTLLPADAEGDTTLRDWLGSPTRAVRRHFQIWPDGALVLAENVVDGPMHRAFGATVKLGLGAPFRIERARGEPLTTTAAITRPGAAHRIDASGTVLVDLIVDPESDEFAAMSAAFSGPEDVSEVPSERGDALVRRVREMLLEGRSGRAVAEAVVACLAETPGKAAPLDPRVRKTARYLKAHFGDGWRLPDLAQRVGLSGGRLGHLFRDQMGVSVQAYVTWLRIRDVVYAVASGASLTTAAHASGFSDLPHLSRTFQATFGEPPSILLPRGGEPVLTFDLSDASSSAHAETDTERIARVRRHARARR